MANKDRPAEGLITKIKQWISWSWKYLWGIWFLMIVVLLWTLRGPLKLIESLNFGKHELKNPNKISTTTEYHYTPSPLVLYKPVNILIN